MTLPPTKEWSHGRSLHAAIAEPALGFRPQQRNRIVGRVVVEDERQRAPAISEAQMLDAAHVGVRCPQHRVVILLRQGNEVIMTARDLVNRQIRGQGGTETEMSRLSPSLADQRSTSFALAWARRCMAA